MHPVDHTQFNRNNIRVLDEKIISLLPGGPTVLCRVLKIFLKSMQQQITDMESGLEQEDVTQIMRASHTLKSSSAMLGAIDLSRLCKEIEAVTLKGELAGIEYLVQQVRKAGQRVEDDIHTHYLQNEGTRAT